MINKNEALMRVAPKQLDQLLHPTLDELAKKETDVLTKGLPASPGAAVGVAVFSADVAKEAVEEGYKVILVRLETSPEDIEGMNVAQGILTARGGMTSHAAVVARGMGKCCVSGCNEIQVDEKTKTFKVKDKVIKEGEFITLDGSTGEVFYGKIPVKELNFGDLQN
jgi:pyruvate,orthophosphate dikinase